MKKNLSACTFCSCSHAQYLKYVHGVAWSVLVLLLSCFRGGFLVSGDWSQAGGHIFTSHGWMKI